jgi:hypothetical protein
VEVTAEAAAVALPQTEGVAISVPDLAVWLLAGRGGTGAAGARGSGAWSEAELTVRPSTRSRLRRSIAAIGWPLKRLTAKLSPVLVDLDREGA